MASKLDNSSLFKNIPVTARHDVYPAISPEPYFSGSSTTFQNKVVLVTGASKGIGLSIASFYARAGAKLAILSRSQKTLDEAKDRIISESGSSAVDVLALAVDVADTKGVEEFVDSVLKKYGRLDVVVANSAITGPWKKPFADNSDPYEDWWKVLEVNIRGTYNVAHYVLPHLAKMNGTLVAISSIAAQLNLRFSSAYSVSKVALDRFIEFAAIEYPSVKSFAVHPGSVQTELAIAVLPECPHMIDTLQLPAATILKLTDGSGRFDWLSGRFISANWDLEELERDWKDEILNKGMLVTRYTT